MSFVIEKGVDVPSSAKGKKQKSEKYPHAVMEVGDSFFVAAGVRGATLGNICAMNRKKGLELGRKFIARSVEGGVRTWRIE